ncbi:MAG: thiamine pyrophosphate-binding protein [Chloroflexi bacterium]|nr:thiamine pyrophosphate-binding protein [Chloroflexota bacterium]
MIPENVSPARASTSTGASVVVQSLVEAGVEYVFGISGVHAVHLFDEVTQSSLRLIVPRHEQAAAFMADGYARASGRVGVCLATTGPGAANTVAGMGTAYMDSSRVLQITSQQAREFIGRLRGRGHDTKDQAGMFRSVTQWNTLIGSPEQIRPMLADAFCRLMTGRPRPVQIDVPLDVLGGPARRTAPATLRTHDTAPPTPDRVALTEVARRLAAAQRPAIWAGGGIMTAEAYAELDTLARRLGAPIFTSATGRNAVSSDHPLFLGALIVDAEVRRYLAHHDLLLALGTTFRADDTGDWMLRLPPMVQVDIEAEQIGKNYPVEAAVVGDARQALRGLLDILGAGPHPELASRTAAVAELRRAALDRARAEYPTELAIVDQLRAGLPRDALFVFDRSLPLYWAIHFLDVFEPRSLFQSAEFGTLGWAFPAALGAQLARPDRRVVCICGDGAIMFSCQELATAAQHQIPVTLLVINDQGYGSNRRNAVKFVGRANPADDIRSPDFVQFAGAFGIPAVRLDDVGQIAGALREASNAPGPVLIEVPLDTIEFPPRDRYGDSLDA